MFVLFLHSNPTYGRYTSPDTRLDPKIGQPWCAAAFAHSAAYGPAAPKPGTSPSSPHHGQCCLCLVWSPYMWELSNRMKYTHSKSVRIFYYYHLHLYCARFAPQRLVFHQKSPSIIVHSISRRGVTPAWLSNQLEIFFKVVQRTRRSSAICIVVASRSFAVAERICCNIFCL
jgi:hypothetical protein